MSIRVISRGSVLGLVLTILFTSLFSFAVQVARGDSLLLEMTVDKTIINVGESVDFSLTLTNTGANNVTITYTPPLFDVMYCSGGECYRWSDDKVFIQVILKLTLEPGENYTRTLSWDLCQYHDGEFYPPEPGEYGLVGMCYHLRVFTRIPIIITVVDADILVPYDYPTIQEAINAANEGDTIFVRNGTYYEHVTMNKSVSLIGENKETTIIDGNGTGTVVQAIVDRVNISGFTIQDGGSIWAGSSIWLSNSEGSIIRGNKVRDNYWYGIGINHSHSVIIDGNIATNNDRGIWIVHSDNCTVKRNTANYNLRGIWLQNSRYSTIAENKAINNTYDGIVLYKSNNNLASNNIVESNNVGLKLEEMGNHIIENTVVRNIINGNSIGIWLSDSQNNRIYYNNFINNIQQVFQYGYYYNNDYWDNGCEGNYWSNYDGSDLNEDGIGDEYLPWETVDYYPLMNVYWNPCDINHDLMVDMQDVGNAARAFDTQEGDSDWNPHVDITGFEYLVPDGTVDMRDIGLIARNFGEEYQL